MNRQLFEALGTAQSRLYELRFINDAVTGAVNEIDGQYTLSSYTPVVRRYLAEIAAALDAAEAVNEGHGV